MDSIRNMSVTLYMCSKKMSSDVDGQRSRRRFLVIMKDTYNDADPFETVHELVVSVVTTAEDSLIRAIDSSSL